MGVNNKDKKKIELIWVTLIIIIYVIIVYIIDITITIISNAEMVNNQRPKPSFSNNKYFSLDTVITKSFYCKSFYIKI